MGMLDSSTKLAVNQAATAVGDTASSNIYDSGNAASADIGLSNNLWLQAQVGNTGATSGGAATVQPVLQTSTDGVTWTDAASGPATALAGLTANAVLWQTPLPLNLSRYLRIAWRIAGAVLTGGTFTSFVSADIQRNLARPSGFTVQ